ncbi:hypothetical protein M9Y10_038950 [Tritrichomonas musculus]|uniref:39 kDa initiator binding protein n=1 Tax=Tritrichomonas musculus TaxID=1915356 RepID=A0ABR2K9V9_9EUKA
MDSVIDAPNEGLSSPDFAARHLPKNIQDIIHRRSSRDPSSRFSRKLHALLSYVSANPNMEDEIGLSWIDDEIFQVNKKRLLEIMGIKLNTLNVNFKNLEFVQLHSDRPGWTRWRKRGFTKRAIIGEKQNIQNPNNINVNPNDNNGNDVDFFNAPPPEEEKVELKLGHMTTDQIDILTQHVNQEWHEIVGDMKSTNATYFIQVLANRYKQPEQPFENASDVLKAILAPKKAESIKFSDFYRFMSMFGPAETVMLKIHSLLEAAMKPSPWLYFGLIPDAESSQFFGYFNEQEPNCLMIHDKKGNYEYLWNLPLTPSNESYVIDSQNNKYTSWESYFQTHPISEFNHFDEPVLTNFVP